MPKTKDGLVDLFENTPIKTMVALAWEPIEASDYLGDRPKAESNVLLSQDLGLFG